MSNAIKMSEIIDNNDYYSDIDWIEFGGLILFVFDILILVQITMADVPLHFVHHSCSWRNILTMNQ